MDTKTYYWYMFKVNFSILTYCADVVSDIILVIYFFLDKEIIYSVLTLIFILIPYLINYFISVTRFQAADRDRTKSFVIPSLLSPLWRYVQGIKALWKVKNKKTEIKEFQHHMLECNILKLFECLLESAPQLSLQLYIWIHTHINVDADEDTNTVIFQYLSMSISFVSIAWNIKNCFTSEEEGLHVDVSSPPFTVPVCYFLWQISSLVSRILCISIMLSYAPKSTIAMLLIHWISISLWMALSNSFNFFFCIFGPLGKLKKNFLCVIWGFSYIFTISTRDYRYRPKNGIYLIYYIIVTIETTIATMILMSSSNGYWQNLLYLKSTMIYLICYLLLSGLIFRVIYEKFSEKHAEENRNKRNHLKLKEHLALIENIVDNYLNLNYYFHPRNNIRLLVYFMDTEEETLLENITSKLTTVIIPNFFGLLLTHQNCNRENCQSCKDMIHQQIVRYIEKMELRHTHNIVRNYPSSSDRKKFWNDLQSKECFDLDDKLTVLQSNCKWWRNKVIKDHNQWDLFHHLTFDMRTLDSEQENHAFAELHEKLVNLGKKTMSM